MSVDQTYTENELLKRMAEGDEAAFTEIYNQYWERLYVMACHRVRSSEDAREIIQNVFFDLWKKRETRVAIDNLSMYLAGMVRFMVYRHLDNSRRRESLARDIHAAGTPDTAPVADLDNKQLLEILTGLTNTLPSHYKLVFIHHKLMDRPLEEVAAQLGVSVRTAERYVADVMKIMRKTRNHLSFTLLML